MESTLAGLDPGMLELEFPSPMGGQRMGTRQFLLGLCSHLGYHLGQINYHRRLAAALPAREPK